MLKQWLSELFGSRAASVENYQSCLVVLQRWDDERRRVNWRFLI